jgi:transposase-like protein
MKNSPPAGKGPHRDLAKEQSWRDLLKQFAASGQSVREFCSTHRLNETAFYFWRGETQRRDGQAPVRRQHATTRPVAFTKVLVGPSVVAEESLRLRLGNGRELLLPASWPVERLAALVRAVEDAA